MLLAWPNRFRGLLFGIFVCLCCVACGTATTSTGAATAATPTAAVLTLASPPPEPTATAALPISTTLVVGVNATFKPFEYVDEQGNLAGFDIDLITALAARGGFTVTWVDQEFASLLPGVVNGNLDLAISAITITEHRQRLVDFTDPYFETGQELLAFQNAGQGLAVQATNTTIQAMTDLNETVRVGVQSSTTGDFFLTERTTARIVRFDTAPQALFALASGEVDAVLTDAPVVAQFIKDYPDRQLHLVSGPVVAEQYAIAVHKNQPELRALLNQLLAQIKTDGGYTELFERWFGEP
ncbi:MAG: basic amino acid ABC transporter substrate-binding protein [Caldilineaceae bacterium]|nr:basic amino acid ABC transporter substrate-binding protein [Caldilineaceae bacterium]